MKCLSIDLYYSITFGEILYFRKSEYQSSVYCGVHDCLSKTSRSVREFLQYGANACLLSCQWCGMLWILGVQNRTALAKVCAWVIVFHHWIHDVILLCICSSVLLQAHQNLRQNHIYINSKDSEYCSRSDYWDFCEYIWKIYHCD